MLAEMLIVCRRVLKFDTTDEMYRNMSCINYWSGIEKPMIFINAVDDPLFYPRLLNNVRDATSQFSTLHAVLKEIVHKLCFDFRESRELFVHRDEVWRALFIF